MIGEIGFSGATYCAMEFEGPVIDALSIEERMTICNMAIEAGGKNGVIAADAKVEAYVKERTDVPYTLFKADADAKAKAEAEERKKREEYEAAQLALKQKQEADAEKYRQAK